MQLKTLWLRFTAAAVLGLGALSAQADPITGDWLGSWTGDGVTATFNMTIGAQDVFGRFDGAIDWTCTSGFACSGTELITGGVGPFDSFAFWTTGFINPKNLGSAIYWGTITDDDNTLVGVDSANPKDTWIAHRNVPEPSTLALFGLGLIGLGFLSRKNLPAAKTLSL